MKFVHPLEDCLESCCIIRTTFETINFVRLDDVIREELSEIIQDTQTCLVQRLKATVDYFLTDHQSLRFLDTSMLRLLQEGVSGKWLNTYLKLGCFSEDETYFLLTFDGENQNRENLLKLPLTLFFAMQINCLRARAEIPEHYADLQAFDREIFLPLMQLIYLHFSATDPLIYR